MPGLRPKNSRTSAGFRDSSSFTLSAVREAFATAAEIALSGTVTLAVAPGGRSAPCGWAVAAPGTSVRTAQRDKAGFNMRSLLAGNDGLSRQRNERQQARHNVAFPTSRMTL